jgi:hypothetical protein
MILSINALDIESIASEKCGVDSAARYTTLNLPSGSIQGHPSDHQIKAGQNPKKDCCHGSAN